MLLDTAIVAVVGGIIGLDRIYLQSMISRPVVAGTITGLILKDPYTGLVTGALVELIWIDQSPIGTSIPPNDTVSAILITACAILSGSMLGSLSQELIVTAILLFLPSAVIARKIDIWIITTNDILSKKALEDASAGNIKRVAGRHLTGLVKSLLCGVAFLLVALVLGTQILIWIFPKVPAGVLRAFTYTYYFLPLLGIAVTLNTIRLRGMIPVLCSIFLVAALLIELLL
ncbi:MAG: PTS sugar transporter subunit IIC [Syntrophales bacterium]